MPYNRPHSSVYVTNGSTALTHGQTVIRDNFVGVAVKQQARSWKDGHDIQATIDATEDYLIVINGIVQVDDTGISTPAVGDAVYIKTSDNTLTKTSASNTPFGRIVEVAGDRGTPTGTVRIDLDAKASAVAGTAF